MKPFVFLLLVTLGASCSHGPAPAPVSIKPVYDTNAVYWIKSGRCKSFQDSASIYSHLALAYLDSSTTALTRQLDNFGDPSKESYWAQKVEYYSNKGRSYCRQVKRLNDLSDSTLRDNTIYSLVGKPIK